MFVIIHTWPDKHVSIMPSCFRGEVNAQQRVACLGTAQQTFQGHSYAYVRLPEVIEFGECDDDVAGQ